MTAHSRDDIQRPRLGRGLAALLGEGHEGQGVQSARAQRQLPIERLRANTLNPRKVFDAQEMENLAQSIRSRGVLQPILVRPLDGSTTEYEIVAGERRWRAAQMAFLSDVPVIIIEADNKQALEIAIIENVQRDDLNAIEEAEGYQRLCVDYGYTHLDLAQEIGKSRSYVANSLRLLNLPSEVRKMLSQGDLTAGHARALLTADDPLALAQTIRDQKLSVREIEQVARVSRNGKHRNSRNPMEDKPHAAMVDDLSTTLGMKITVSSTARGGRIIISYSSQEQLDYLFRLLSTR